MGFDPSGEGSGFEKERKRIWMLSLSKKRWIVEGPRIFGPTKVQKVLNILQIDYRSLLVLVNSIHILIRVTWAFSVSFIFYS